MNLRPQSVNANYSAGQAVLISPTGDCLFPMANIIEATQVEWDNVIQRNIAGPIAIDNIVGASQTVPEAGSYLWRIKAHLLGGAGAVHFIMRFGNSAAGRVVGNLCCDLNGVVDEETVVITISDPPQQPVSLWVSGGAAFTGGVLAHCWYFKRLSR